MKIHDIISKTGLRHRLFPRTFQILEQPFCRAHACIFSWSFDVFIVFSNTVVFGPCHSQEHKRTVTQRCPRKRVHRKCFFLEQLHGCGMKLYFKKLFTTLALFSRLIYATRSIFKLSVAGGGFSGNLINSIYALLLIDEKSSK